MSVLHPRGSGYSSGSRGDLGDFQSFLGDHRQGLAHLHQTYSPLPIFLLGHSVGAAYVLELAAHAEEPLCGIILVNPAYRLLTTKGMTPSWREGLAFAVNAVFRPASLTVDMNSRPHAIEHPADRAEAEAMQADPLVVRFFSLRFLVAQRQVMRRCVKNARAIRAPLLIVKGAGDALVDPCGTDEILAAANSADKSALVAPHGGHGSSAVETLVPEILRWLAAHT